jgi:hypothetical protein
MHKYGYVRLSPLPREELLNGEVGARPRPISQRSGPHRPQGLRVSGMRGRIKTILILCGFSLVMLAAKGAADIAQGWLGDWLGAEELTLLVGLPVVAFMMMELVRAGPLARNREKHAYQDEAASNAS